MPRVSEERPTSQSLEDHGELRAPSVGSIKRAVRKRRPQLDWLVPVEADVDEAVVLNRSSPRCAEAQTQEFAEPGFSEHRRPEATLTLRKPVLAEDLPISVTNVHIQRPRRIDGADSTLLKTHREPRPIVEPVEDADGIPANRSRRPSMHPVQQARHVFVPHRSAVATNQPFDRERDPCTAARWLNLAEREPSETYEKHRHRTLPARHLPTPTGQRVCWVRDSASS